VGVSVPTYMTQTGSGVDVLLEEIDSGELPM